MGSKKKTIPKICETCSQEFLAADVKAKWCHSCKNPPPVLCACGCGNYTKSGWSKCCSGHGSRLDTEAIREGHQKQAEKIKGNLNPSKRKEVRKVISEKLQGRWCAGDGKTKEEQEALKDAIRSRSLKSRKKNGLRSSLEEKFLAFYMKKDIDPQYENGIKLSDGRWIYPDFRFGNNLVEVTGFAYKAWQDQFIEKVTRILKDGYNLTCVTYPNKVDLLKSLVPDCVTVISIEDLKMYTVTRKFPFDYGHRVLEHGSKCKYLHGHLGIAEVTVSSLALDKLGMVVDFGDLKNIIGSWIDEHFDHGVLLHKNDPLLKNGIDYFAKEFNNGKLPYVMQANPTAENIALEILSVSRELLKHIPGISVESVRVWETPNCCAERR